MGKRKKIKGMRSLKNMGTAIKTPISGSRDSSYLELYILDKKRKMIEAECLSLDNRKAELLKNLEDIKSKMAEFKEAEESQEVKTQKEMIESTEKNWKTMKVDY